MCNKSIWLVLLALGLFAATSATHAQVVNLVQNPSFEEDEVILDDPAWEQWATWGYEGGLSSTVAFDDTEFIDGARSLRIMPKGTTNWHFIVLTLPIPLTVGTPYTASFWAKAEEPRPLTVQFKDTANKPVTWGLTDFQLTTDWAEYSMTSPAQDAEMKLEFFCSGSEVPFWMDFVNVYEGEYIADVTPSGAVSPEKARRPEPADGAVVDLPRVTLKWQAGGSAVTHNVYFGEDFDAVNEGLVEAIPTPFTTLPVGAAAPYETGLTPGQTYYWRVDEVNNAEPDSPWKGDVWSFRVRPLTSFDPSPANGTLYVDPNQDLTWDYGLGSIIQTVYFGKSFEEVSNAKTGGWMTVQTFYDPKTMEIGQTYYWRVDEFTGPTTHKGEVWSFTIVPQVAITDPDLVGWWTLDEGMGTSAVDWSGHGLHGRIVGNAQWTHGVHGGALYLSGGANVEIPAPHVTTNTATMTAWVKRDGTQADWAAILFSRTGSSVAGMGFGPANELRYHWTDKYWDFATGIVPPDQEWFFLALVVEPTQGTLYFNGTDISVKNVAAHAANPFDGVLRIGQDQPGRDLKGTVDDVRFYTKALSQARIKEIMRGDLRLAWSPTPAPDAALDIRDADSLSWLAGDAAASHDVYLGADREAVAKAGKESPEYRGNRTATSLSLDGLVELGGDYCWRIDEVQADGAVQAGEVWEFAVLSYLLIDDFESYDDDKDGGTAIYQTWIDGVDNGTGSYVGYDAATNGTFGETKIVHGGRQSMPLQYDNAAAPGYSEADRSFSPAQNWTTAGVTTLVVHFRGAAGNTGKLYVKINGTKVAYNGDAADIASTKWIAWKIDLASAGVSLASVKKLTIGVEEAGKGIVYVDDIRLTKP